MTMAPKDIGSNNAGDNNDRKIHVSRIPTSFDEKTVKRILEEILGQDSVEEITLIYKRPYQEEGDESKNDDAAEDNREITMKNKREEESSLEHRGIGFVTFSTHEIYKEAIQLESIRGGRKATSSRKHTLYLRPYTEDEDSQKICYLWSKFRCPYGDECKFKHHGQGGCLTTTKGDSNKKKQKCFAFKKGKCKRGDACPFSHDFVVNEREASKDTTLKSRTNSEKDCINWKTKGKCRKRDTCPYRHDEGVREAALLRKKRKNEKHPVADGDCGSNPSKRKKRKQKQPLWIQVFGLNYETKEHDIREFLKHCGTIMEVQFPCFEDSGRSKGYCGIRFQSPKAVAKALELDGEELMGRWLRIQTGKMQDQWEEQRNSS